MILQQKTFRKNENENNLDSQFLFINPRSPPELPFLFCFISIIIIIIIIIITIIIIIITIITMMRLLIILAIIILYYLLSYYQHHRMWRTITKGISFTCSQALVRHSNQSTVERAETIFTWIV